MKRWLIYILAVGIILGMFYLPYELSRLIKISFVAHPELTSWFYLELTYIWLFYFLMSATLIAFARWATWKVVRR